MKNYESTKITNNLIIRNAKVSDYDEVSILEELVFKLHRNARPDYFRDLEQSYSREEYEELLASPCPISLVAIQNEKIIGICFGKIENTPENAVCLSRRIAFIQDLVILPEFRGNGVATALMAEARKLALQKEAAGIELCVWNFNENALRFYKKAGMKIQYCRLEETLMN